jgi:hypothetical protein
MMSWTTRSALSGFAVGHDDLCSVDCEPFGSGLTQTGSGTGDDADLSVDRHVLSFHHTAGSQPARLRLR